ncbi:hypothetical protein WG908_12900 [Sphingobium sp. AN641]|uniref:hypothetical protein n=1 Tax=Sphingobium sp. AN641 TaxID=3133443 RepID=UPI0030BDE1F7
MPKCVISLFLAALAATSASIALAASDDGAWTTTADTVRVSAAGIAAPMSAGTLALDRTGEISNGGRGIDNVAQYVSADGAVQGTIYIYMPGFADAALGAYMTDRAIMDRFGGKTRRTSYDSVSVGGQPGAAIRAVYDDAADGHLTTAAALLHTGRWMVKLRITGPSERRAEVLAGLDAMLAGLRFDAAATPLPAAPLAPASCLAPARGIARLLYDASTDITARQPGFPRDGRDALCVRGHVETTSGALEILQSAGDARGSVLVPVDDGGTVMAFDPVGTSGGYRLSIHSVGRTEVYDAYDRLPSETQIAAMLDGKDPATARARSTTAYGADGARTLIVASKGDRKGR